MILSTVCLLLRENSRQKQEKIEKAVLKIPYKIKVFSISEVITKSSKNTGSVEARGSSPLCSMKKAQRAFFS